MTHETESQTLAMTLLSEEDGRKKIHGSPKSSQRSVIEKVREWQQHRDFHGS